MIEIDLSDRVLLQAIVDKVQVNAYERFEAFFEEATLAYHLLPRNVRKGIHSFRHYTNYEGALILRGFPGEKNLPPTPTHSIGGPRKTTCASEFWLCCIASALGDPVAYRQEKGGSIFHDIFPTRVNADKLSSESSSIILDFHTELAFHHFLPDYILLYGLRQDPERSTRTSIANVAKVVPLLTPAHIHTLFEPKFKTGIDYSFGSPNGMKGNGPILSVLYGNRDTPFLRFDPDLMLGLTLDAQEALKHLKYHLAAVVEDVIIEPGMMMVIDNRRCVHARSTFNAHYDGNDRWIQRILVIQDIARSARDRAPDSRTITTDFQEYLGR